MTSRARYRIAHRMARIKAKAERNKGSAMSMAWMNSFYSWCELHDQICNCNGDDCQYG